MTAIPVELSDSFHGSSLRLVACTMYFYFSLYWWCMPR